MNNFINNFKRANRDMPKSTYIIYGIILLFFLYALALKIFYRPQIIIFIFAIFLSLSIHEAAHAFMAEFNGDPTAKISGRLSLNPLRHLDILGTIIPIILYLMNSGFIFGWAKPVPVNYQFFKNRKKGIILVSLAGVLMNLALAIISAVLVGYFFKMEFNFFGLKDLFSPMSFKLFLNPKMMLFIFLIMMLHINIFLFCFNILPIPPLDGSKLVYAFLEEDYKKRKIFEQMEKYSFLIILILFWSGIISMILNPFFTLVYSQIIKLI